MTMKTLLKVSLAIVIVILFVIFYNRGDSYVEKGVVNYLLFEHPPGQGITSCQPDCTFVDRTFHSECVGFNGCEDTPFIRDREYCEQDSDCVVDFGCCTESCEELGCEEDSGFCSVSNSHYAKAHSFSCNGNVLCSRHVKCKSNYETACVENKCRILK